MIFPTYSNAVDTRTLRHLLKRFARGVLLDVGCGDGNIRRWLPPGTTYEGIDQEASAATNRVGDIHHLPYEAASFDTVVCTSVLEHVQDTEQVTKELHRVLRPGGNCIVTIPFMLHYHQDPEDYRRLTEPGLAELLHAVGFTKVQTFANYGVYAVVEFSFFSVLVHARRNHLWFKRWYSPLYYAAVACFFLFFKLVAYGLHTGQHIDTSMYVGVAAVATKP
jgi:SAM-dependent methyltransferase